MQSGPGGGSMPGGAWGNWPGGGPPIGGGAWLNWPSEDAVSAPTSFQLCWKLLGMGFA